MNNNKFRLFANCLAIISTLVLLTSCGGGDSTPTENSNNSPTINSFVASSYSIKSGMSSQLTADFDNGDGEIDNGIGEIVSGQTIEVFPIKSTTYTLVVKNSAGDTVSKKVDISVEIPPDPAISSFSAAQTEIYEGDSTTITPVFDNGTATITNIEGEVVSGKEIIITPDKTTTYVLKVINDNGASVTVSLSIKVTKDISKYQFGGPNPLIARRAHTATLIQDGSVLIMGGENTHYLDKVEKFDPVTGNFSMLASRMVFNRAGHEATLLDDGRVLITGGVSYQHPFSSVVDTAEIYDPVSGKFTALENTMNSPRSGHTATLLSDGTVLIAGGLDGKKYIDTAEIFDPETGSFTLLTNIMTSVRGGHTATLLNDGKVFLNRGTDGAEYLGSSEVYDPETGIFSIWETKATFYRRSGHSATMLANGLILFTGGFNKAGTFDIGKLYDPVNDTLVSTSQLMQSIRSSHTATLLKNNTVLITGGGKNVGFGGGSYQSAEIYHPDSSTFTSTTDNWSYERINHTATLLNDGTVLIAGGEDHNFSHSNASLLDIVSNKFTNLKFNMTVARSRHTATRLSDGKVLITGGISTGDVVLESAEIFDPVTSDFTALPYSMSFPRNSHTATLLSDGKVLITGGHAGSIYLDSCEIFDPESGKFTLLDNSLTMARADHTATKLDNGTILFTGGHASNDAIFGKLNTAEIYDPVSGGFTLLSSTMAIKRRGHTATKLNNGYVLISGSYSNLLTEDADFVDIAEIYDPVNNEFITSENLMTGMRRYHTATQLNDNSVLIIGGYNGIYYTGTVQYFYYE